MPHGRGRMNTESLREYGGWGLTDELKPRSASCGEWWDSFSSRASQSIVSRDLQPSASAIHLRGKREQPTCLTCLTVLQAADQRERLKTQDNGGSRKRHRGARPGRASAHGRLGFLPYASRPRPETVRSGTTAARRPRLRTRPGPCRHRAGAGDDAHSRPDPRLPRRCAGRARASADLSGAAGGGRTRPQPRHHPAQGGPGSDA